MLETATRPLLYDGLVQTLEDLTSERRQIARRCSIRVARHVQRASMKDDHVNRSTRARGLSDRELGTRPVGVDVDTLTWPALTWWPRAMVFCACAAASTEQRLGNATAAAHAQNTIARGHHV